ncbi:MAG: NAD(P)/FAD-dependent oxidoreductase [Coriobacteriales bacterium]|jgi:2,4-dienoyl-CoA reductase-like NADH-dependent reductase (Old Yellow Enzyme family)/thioredoxin reductase|nr:NAD(P)/FAD-dependent oxidoreductase [Coriobacteriales bacterium]
MSSEYKNIFNPITIKGLTYKNRLEVSPHVPGWGAVDGTVTAETEAFWRAYARGGAALINMGNCAIDMAEAKDEAMQIDLSRDEVIVGLSHLRETCAQFGSVLSLEINHCGRGAGKYYPDQLRYGPSNIPLPDEAFAYHARGEKVPDVIPMSTDKIYETVEKFARAASRCKRAGFEHLLIHGAHGNLITQFLSPMSNKRNDNYGGSLHNRARFGVEVMQAIREAIGHDIVIEMRVSSEDGIPEGVQTAELIEFARMLEDYVDVFIVSYGMMGMPQLLNKMMAGPYHPYLHNLEYIKAFKAGLKRAKVSAVGTLQNLDNCEYILANGWADFTALCRPFIADPALAKKGARNKRDEIRPCVRCMLCGIRVSSWFTCGCSVNPYSGKELEFPEGRVYKTDAPKKVMVVGGGLAGLQAAWSGTERGHEVTVFEKTDVLGGNFNHVGTLPFKQDARAFYEYFMPKATSCGAKFVLNTEVTRELVESEKPDVVIVAAGAEHIKPPIPGIDGAHVHFAHEADRGTVALGKRVAVIGAGTVGLESALNLAREGHEVTVIDFVYPENIESMTARFELPALLAQEKDTKLYYGTIVEQIGADTIVCRDRTSCKSFEVPCDNVLIAAGLRPRTEIYEEILHNNAVSECDIYLVGDVKAPRQIGQAVNEAFDVVVHI